MSFGDDTLPFRIEGDLYIIRDSAGKAVYAVGSGAGLPFALDYFPEATKEIRLATGYFQLRGYNECKASIGQNVKLNILVGREEGAHVADVINDAIASTASLPKTLLAELSSTNERLYRAVDDILERIEKKQFFIAEAGEVDYGQSRLFHCKFYICDTVCMWSGSANFTGRGLKYNDENADFSRDANKIAMHHAQFDNKMKTARNLLEEVENCLLRWRDMATPFEAYLRMLDWWHTEQKVGMKSGGKTPTYYQEAIISRALQQISRYKGALLLVATGLGKTVIGAELVARFTARLNKKHVILLAPRTVKTNWMDDELRPRNLFPYFFDLRLLFKKSSDTPQMNELLQRLSECDENSLVLIDEAHYYRGILDKEANTRKRKSPSYTVPPIRVKQRLNLVAQKGASIVLLTATPYGTDIQDLRSLLSLLPPQASGEVDFPPKEWAIKKVRDISALNVVTILGISHLLRLASEKGDIEKDAEGRDRIFIAMPDGQKRYFPKQIIRNNKGYTLFAETEMEKAFDKGAFGSPFIFHSAYDEQTDRYKPRPVNIGEATARRAWFSSPAALELFLQKCCDAEDKDDTVIGESHNITLDELTSDEVTADPADLGEDDTTQVTETVSQDDKEKKKFIHFNMKRTDRQKELLPILRMLRHQSMSDEKIHLLVKVLQERHQAGEKVIIFVNWHSTAVYLQEKIARLSLLKRVACTVQKSNSGYKLDEPQERLSKICEFSPCSNQREGNNQWGDKYDILICTDADGVGINMEDACVVIN